MSDLIEKCQGCENEIPAKSMEENLRVCPECGYHHRLSSRKRLEVTMDPGSFKEFFGEMKSGDPLQFPEYGEKLGKAMKGSGLNEAVVCGLGSIQGMQAAVCAMDGNFMMGSMGSVVGEKITATIELAVRKKLPLIIFTVSGGARMQEGVFSLMQMAKVSGAVKRHSNAGLLYITVLTDPTTGGVTASFAMQGDILVAEPDALIGFAGRRVIESTIRHDLPKEFQRAEFLLEKGFVDMISDRRKMRDTLYQILRIHKGGAAR